MFFSWEFLESVLWKAVAIFRLWLDLVAYVLCALFHLSKRKKTLPAPRNLIVCESAVSLAKKIGRKEITSEDVVYAFMERIGEVNLILNCVVDQRFTEALKEAQKIDDFLSSLTPEEGDVLRNEKPLLGVPFTVKESICVKGLSHTCGLVARSEVKASENADVVTLLRRAGGIPLATTNLSELGMWYECSNPVFGTTANPYCSSKTSGGSSGGEACLQTVCGSPLGIGTDIGGSIRIPSLFCGTFGHKPTPGVVSIAGTGPHKLEASRLPMMLCAGPIAKHVEDLLLALKIMAGPNADMLQLHREINIRKLKFYYMEDDGGCPFVSVVSPKLKSVMKKVVQHFRETCQIEVKQVQIKKMKRAIQMWFSRLKEDKSGTSFSEELTNRKGPIKPRQELLKWCFGRSHHTLAALGFSLLEEVNAGHLLQKFSPLEENELMEFKNEMQDILGDNGVLLYPSHTSTALYHGEPLFKPFNFAYTAVFNLLDMPATQVPLGLDSNGLPCGIQVAAAPFCDKLTLAVAQELSRVYGGWVPPFPTT